MMETFRTFRYTVTRDVLHSIGADEAPFGVSDDQYLFVMVCQCSPSPSGMLYRVVSTTTAALMKADIKRLQHRGIFPLTDVQSESVMAEILIQHFGRIQTVVAKKLSIPFYVLPKSACEKLREPLMHENGAGDCDPPYEFIVPDPDLDDFERLCRL